MFKRLADRVSSAVASVVTASSSPSQVDTLKSMGFSEGDSRHALQVSGDNVEQAAEWLLTNGTTTTNQSRVTMNNEDIEEDDLQKALQASLGLVETNNQNNNNNHHRPQSQSAAASRRAGEAALARFGTITTKPKNKKKPPPPTTTTTTAAVTVTIKPKNTTTTTTTTPISSHPKVQMPKRMSQHDKESQIMRLSQRIAPYPLAVDTLLKSLKQLQQHPNDSKFQTIDTSSAGFQKSSLNDVPGVLDYFKAMNYVPSYNNPKVLQFGMLDPATLYLGISALEQVQQTSKDYMTKKASMAFDEELEQILSLADRDMTEAIKRSEFLSKCPSEPTTGGSWMTVELGSTNTKKTIKRKFDSDDTLEDVLHWLGGHGSTIPEKLVSNEWHLVNRNHANSPPYHVSDLQSKTLQYIGCFPSGRLAIVPATVTAQNTSQQRMPSQSRGLGAAPMEALKL